MSDATPIPVLHVSPTREDRGGIQSMLRRHHARDAALGLRPRFLSIFDRESSWPGETAALAAHGWQRVRTVQRHFATAVAPWRESVAIYHDGWGVEWFAECDAAARRIVYLHTERPQADELVRIFAPRADGFIAVSRSYAERVTRWFPDFPAERISVLPIFVEPPVWLAGVAARGRAPGPLRLGYAGRVERNAKRLDRLPALVAELDKRKIDFRCEILGDGSYRSELQRTLRDSRVTFPGWKSGDDYWRTISAWDVVVMLSDYEGFSRAVMECMCAGAIPVHPDFSPAAKELLGPAAPAGLYPTGDTTAAAERIAQIAQLADGPLRQLRLAGAAHFAAHRAEAYDRRYAEFVRHIAALPRRSAAPPLARTTALLPVGLVTRLHPERF